MSTVKQTLANNQLLNIHKVIEYTTLSRAMIYQLLNPKSEHYDATFPKQIQLTTGRVAWIAEEVSEWIESRIEQRA